MEYMHTWKSRLHEWYEAQKDTAGFEKKLESFIGKAIEEESCDKVKPKKIVAIPKTYTELRSWLDQKASYLYFCSESEQEFQDEMKIIYDQICANLYFSECAGCTSGHSSFWRTIVESPQWDAWIERQSDEMIWDTDESRECGWFSREHFQEFLRFITDPNLEKIRDKVGTLRVNKRYSGDWKKGYYMGIDDVLKFL